MRKVAILGTGHTKFAFAAEKTAVELLSEAALSAIIGSGLSIERHRGHVCGQRARRFLGGARHGAILLC